MATPAVGSKVNINRTQYTYQSDGLWHGSDGSTKSRTEMSSILASSTGVGATPPAAPPASTTTEEKLVRGVEQHFVIQKI